MDLGTVIGLAAGVGLILVAIVGHGEPLGMFGGSLASLLISLPLSRVLSSGRVLKKALVTQRLDPERLIRDLVRYAEIARRDGILSLDNFTHEMQDEFMVRGVQMAVDGTAPEVIEQIMQSELDALGERHKLGRKIFDVLAKYSPAFGMIGTLIGLVIMLQHMENPDRVGAGMAVALLTTLYGVVAANLVFGPIADKLGTRSREEMLMREIAMRGVMAIQSGDNPRVVEQKLRTFLPAKLRSSIDRRAKRAARAA
jgi:chemotaxis protein MotA